MNRSRLYQIYNILLAIFLFSLPISEGIKQISLVLLILLGIYICVKEKINFKLDIINISLILFVVFTIVGCIINQISIKTSLDPLRCVLFFFIIRMIGIDKLNLKLSLYALFSGFILAFIIGAFIKFSSADPMELFELKSIGHVNHSAIFMLIILSVSLSFINQKAISKYFCLITTIFCVIGIIIAGSRATMYLMPIVAFCILFYLNTKNKISLKFSFTLIAICIIIFISYLLMSQDLRLQQQIIKGITSTETRYPIFYSAIYTWLDNPFFGIGSGEFRSIDITQYFPGNPEVRVGHAHNTFLTFLTEKGMVALCAYLVFQVTLFVKLIKNFKSSIIIFVALITLIWQNMISIVNTTFHHENALLLLFLWGLALSTIDKYEKNRIFTA